MQEIFYQFDAWSVLDVLIITVIVYHLLLLIRGTRAAQMLTGITIVVFAFLVSSIFPLTTLNWVMSKFYSSIIVILIILFQDDIRHVLHQMGKKPFIAGAENASSMHVIDEIARAAISLAEKRIGALIVIERNIILSRYIDVGTLLDARISKEALVALFHPTSPIHDGAIIIQGGRLAAAGCFLPLTRDEDVDPNMGTRHRAAIGISQETDAVVVLVSEEAGAASIVVESEIIPQSDVKELRQGLRKLLLDEEVYGEEPLNALSEKKSLFSFLKK